MLSYVTLNRFIYSFIYVLMYRDRSEGKMQLRSYRRGRKVSYGSHAKTMIWIEILFILKYFRRYDYIDSVIMISIIQIII